VADIRKKSEAHLAYGDKKWGGLEKMTSFSNNLRQEY
jgi:hypothetical protein